MPVLPYPDWPPAIDTAPDCNPGNPRSEEHTSELQSLRHLVCRLLLEKKNRTTPGDNDGYVIALSYRNYRVGSAYGTERATPGVRAATDQRGTRAGLEAVFTGTCQTAI